MAKAKKFNIASYKVLKTLLCLFQDNLSMQELISQLELSGYGPYNNYIVSKYINTLKCCGIDIQKINNKYCIINFPIGLKFSSLDTQLLYNIKTKTEKLTTNNMRYTINKLFDKLHLSFYKSGTGLLSSSNACTIKNLEHAYKSNSEIIISNNDDKKISGFVRGIRIIDGKYYFIFANKKGTEQINPDNICHIEFLEKKVQTDYLPSSVTYELYGRLSKKYQLRENERIIKYNEDSIVILNKYEEQDELLQRLLRYDCYCKVISPIEFVNKFKTVINGALSNYGIKPDKQ